MSFPWERRLAAIDAAEKAKADQQKQQAARADAQQVSKALADWWGKQVPTKPTIPGGWSDSGLCRLVEALRAAAQENADKRSQAQENAAKIPELFKARRAILPNGEQ